MKFKILLLVAFCLSSNLHSQTPEQSYFEWTEMPFSKQELAERRSKLMKGLQGLGKTGIVVILGKDGFSYGETFRQLDNFYYFTGLELPNSILVMDLANSETKVFSPQRDLRFESSYRPNDFPGRPLLKDTAIANKSGVSLQDISEFSVLMDGKATEEATIFIDNGRRGEIRFASEDYISSPTPVQILLNALQTKHKGLQFENMYESVARVRMIKSPAEIEIMRKSTAINVEGIKTAAKTIKAGIDERYLEGLSFHYVEKMIDVVKLALLEEKVVDALELEKA